MTKTKLATFILSAIILASTVLAFVVPPAGVGAAPVAEPLYWRAPAVTVNFFYDNPNSIDIHSLAAGKVGTVVAVHWVTTGVAEAPNGAAQFTDGTGGFVAEVSSNPLNLNTCRYTTGHATACSEFGYSAALDAGLVARINSNDDIRLTTTGNHTDIDIDGYFELIYQESAITRTPTLSPTPTIDPAVDAYGLVNGSYEDATLAPWEVENGRHIVGSGSTQPVEGAPYCGNNYFEFVPRFFPSEELTPITGYSGPGTPTPTAYLDFLEVWGERPGLAQRFYWPGGVLYFQAAVRAPLGSSRPNIQLHITQVTSGFNTPAGMEGFWAPGQGLASNTNWQTIQSVSGSVLPPGFYDIEFTTGKIERTGPVYMIDDPNLDSDQSYRFYLDDVSVTIGGYGSGCTNGATNTPSPTRTRTPTATRTPTGTIATTNTPTRTPTSGPVSAWSNCAFEANTTGWQGANWNIQLAGGPIGPRYAQVNSGGVMRQGFRWNGGPLYVSLWVGPGSYGSVRVRNLSSSVVTTVYVAANPAAWARQDRMLSTLPIGNYTLEVIPSSGQVMKIDGVMVAANNYQYCGSTISGTPITPTSGPTSFVSPTFTRTLAVSLTPSATITVTPSRTAFPTRTLAATNTSIPTNTLPPTSTQSGAQLTSTAAGTDIATFTPYPTYTPYATFTPYATPPQQPPPGPGAECVAPQSGDVAGWLAYQQCQSLSFFSFSSTNVAEIQVWSTMAAGHEPFGTVNQTSDFLGDIGSLISGTDWESTGASCSAMAPNTADILRGAQGILLGQFTWTENNYEFNDQCNLLAEDIIGPFIARAICLMLNLLCATGLMQWFEWTTNVIMILVFVAYIKTNWIDKALS